MPDDRNRFVTTSELARILYIGDELVRKLARSGRIPSFVVGAQLRFDLEEVLAVLRGAVPAPNSAARAHPSAPALARDVDPA